MLDNVLHNDFNFFVFVMVSLPCVDVGGVTCGFVLALVIDSVLIGSEHFDKMEVVTCASVAVDDDEAIFEPRVKHAREEFNVCLLVWILPSPVKLVEKLGTVRLQTLASETKPYLPHVVEGRMHYVAADRLSTGEQEHILRHRHHI